MNDNIHMYRRTMCACTKIKKISVAAMIHRHIIVFWREFMKIIYFASDLKFAKRLITLLGKKDTRLIFEIKDYSELLNFKIEETTSYDLIITENSKKVMEAGFDIDLELKGEDKLKTLEELYNMIISAYKKKKGIKSFNKYNGKAKIIYFCSSSGGSGKTSISIGLCQELVRFHDKKVLYLCFEPFESIEKYFEVMDRKSNIDDYLYYLQREKQVDLYKFLIKDSFGVETFKPSYGKNPIYELTADDLMKTIAITSEAGEFDYIICDGYLALSDGEKALLENADKICAVGKMDSSQFEEANPTDARESKMEEYLNEELNVSRENVIKITNFAPIGMSSSETQIVVSYEENFSALNIDKDFGMGIKELSKQII